MMYALWIAPGFWAAKVASDRNRNGAVWAFLALILGPLAILLVYALPGMPIESTSISAPSLSILSGRTANVASYRCPKCEAPVTLDMHYCPGCGGLFKAGVEAGLTEGLTSKEQQQAGPPA